MVQLVERTKLIHGCQLALEVRPLLDDVHHAHPLQPLNNQTQIALSTPLHATHLGDTGVPVDIVLGRLYRVALEDRLAPLLQVLNQQPAIRPQRVRLERHAGDCDSRIWLGCRADAIDLCEDGGDIGSVGDGDLERRAGKDGEGGRKGDERKHLGAGLR